MVKEKCAVSRLCAGICREERDRRGKGPETCPAYYREEKKKEKLDRHCRET